jgi:hypothetical protein
LDEISFRKARDDSNSKSGNIQKEGHNFTEGKTHHEEIIIDFVNSSIAKQRELQPPLTHK